MAAYALFTSFFGESESFLVSGEAQLGSNGAFARDAGQLSGHSWVMRRRKNGSYIMCETTACIETNGHLITAAFAWSSTCAYTFCTRNSDGFTLGVDLKRATSKLPIATHSEAEKKGLEYYLCRVEVPKTSGSRNSHRERIYSLAHAFDDSPTGPSLSKFLDFPGSIADGRVAATMG